MSLVLMPALSPTMTEGKLAKWLVAEGEAVASGDVIAEIETDKALMEVEALDDGVLASIVVGEGSEAVKVGAVIAEILAEGEKSELGKGNKTEAKTAPAKSPTPQTKSTPTPTPTPAKATSLPATPPSTSTKTTKTTKTTGRIFASPLAKRLAGQHGINLASVKGTGPHGRIVKADIEQAASGGGAAISLVPIGEMVAPTRTPISPMRKAIASRLQQSMQQSPHYYVSMDIEMDALMAARKAINTDLEARTSKASTASKVTLNDMLIKCVAATLMRVPAVNAAWDETHIIQHHQADIAVAVAIEGGLITPIVWAADRKPLTIVSSEVADLIAKARAGRLQAKEFTGGSFTISNLGMYGVSAFTAVINPPHAAILAVAAARPTPVVKDGQIVVANIMQACLSCDHRVVDGAVGAEWMAQFKAIVENPILASVTI